MQLKRSTPKASPRGYWRPRVIGSDKVDPTVVIDRIVGSVLDSVKAPGKVRTMAEMSPDELAALVPPRKKA